MEGLLQDLGQLVRQHWWWLLPTMILIGATGGAFLVAGVSNSLIQTTLLKVLIGAAIGGGLGGGAYAGLASLGGGGLAPVASPVPRKRLLLIEATAEGRPRCRYHDGSTVDLQVGSEGWLEQLAALDLADDLPLALACDPRLPPLLTAAIEEAATTAGIPCLPWPEPN
jgi:hypothetical protein